jgi:hypothetical protein
MAATWTMYSPVMMGVGTAGRGVGGAAAGGVRMMGAGAFVVAETGTTGTGSGLGVMVEVLPTGEPAEGFKVVPLEDAGAGVGVSATGADAAL